MTDRDLPATEAVPETATGNDAAAVTSSAPSFRFNPTDEELISNYLKRKVQRKSMRFYEIGEVDVYKIKPSDLPGYSRLKTEDKQCFFFTALEKDHTTGAYMERATNVGYWEETGEDKKILGGDGQLIGVMKSLVFHVGRAPDGWRTDWLIHEYSLVDNEQILQVDAYVLCKVFVKKEWNDGGGGGGALVMEDPVPSVVHANEIQQENDSQSKGKNLAAVTTLAPGFRFHPTDEELVSYYLKRKVQSKTIGCDAIGEADVYKINPSDLPGHSRLKTRDQEWFFFTTLEKKFSKNNSRMKRSTTEGHWKKTGEDKKILGGDGKLIGVMKTFVFYKGRVPNGLRTNWLIYEYSLVQNEQGLQIDAYVLCKVFVKEHAGPSGVIYAPFSEKEWDDDDDDDDGGGGRALVMADSAPSVVHANTINEIQQENHHSQSKNLFDLNELPEEFEIDDDLQTVDNDKPLPLCGLSKEAPLPPSRYKRKRQNDSTGSSNDSIQTTQDHSSSPATTGDTISSLSATLQKIRMEHWSLEEKEPETVATVEPASSSTNLTNDLQNEKNQMAVERETYKLDMTKAELTISILQGRVDKLRAENEELKKNINKGQYS